MDLEHLLDVQLDKIVELLVVTDKKDAHWWHVSLLLLHGQEEIFKPHVLQAIFATLVLEVSLPVRFSTLLLSKDQLKVEQFFTAHIVMSVFEVGKLVRHLNFQNLILERQQDFISHVCLNLVKGNLSSLYEKILRQMLVDIPDVA